jgi:hypothetical protein
LPRLFVEPPLSTAPLLTARILSHRGLAMMILAALICFLPALPRPARFAESTAPGGAQSRHLIPATVMGLVLFILSVCSLANSAYNPFIYFRF